MVKLTPRQLAVCRKLNEGMSNREIANSLGLAYQTVKNSLFKMYELTGMSNRLELLLWFQEHEKDYN